MRFTKTLILVTLLALILVPGAMAGCKKDGHAVEANGTVEAVKADDKPCCAKMGTLTAKAGENGAAKADGVGCSKSAAKAAQLAKAEGADNVDVARLANWAEQGCAKSSASLIAMAKDSGCPKTAALAAKAEGGCAKSSEELIAMMKEHNTAAAGTAQK